jgi:hypothetical protein
MDNDANGQTPNRPYAPPSNITTVLQRLRKRNPPARIDAEFLRDMQISEGTIARAIFALRFLNLIEEDDSPSSALQSIATSTDEEYAEILSGLLREAYSDVFERLDPTQDTQDKFLNFFRRYLPASQRERMVTFFLGMCREAGMQLADAPRQRSTAARAPTSRQSAKGKPGPKKTTSPVAGSAGGERAHDTESIPPALLGLVRSLPGEGESLSSARRNQWLQMAAATLAFVYPEPAEKAAGSEEGNAGDADV